MAQTIDQEIADLEAILNAGATSMFTDGQKATWDLDQVRRRLGELRRRKDHMRRPRIATIDLSGF